MNIVEETIAEAELLRIMREGGFVRSSWSNVGGFLVSWVFDQDGKETESGLGVGRTFAEAVRKAFEYGTPWSEDA